jgi:DNA-binding transcriptional LysR family regulator
MDIAALEAFVAVADAGSFSRGAEHVHLTQPAISKRIAALEDELGARLFDRSGRQAQLTHAGRELLAQARAILSEVSEAKRRIANLAGTVSGPLSLGTSYHIGLHRLRPALSERLPAPIPRFTWICVSWTRKPPAARSRSASSSWRW